MKCSYKPFDLSGVKTYPLATRQSKARVGAFAKPLQPGDRGAMEAWRRTLPAVQAGTDFNAVVDAIAGARERGAGLLWGFGAHVIKTGLGPILIDLMERGYVSALATNGAGAIHDFEIAVAGATSEDVDEALGPGRFGMAEETGRVLNQAVTDGVARGLGFGQSVAIHLHRSAPPHAAHSVFAAAARLEIPITVHVAIGTDITHMHPAASGAAIGEGSLRDFRYLVSNVACLDRGVYLNCGSAVILPEVFLKAVALVRNTGQALTGLTTVNIDFLRLYRPQTNVVTRPVAGSTGHGYSLTGPHELLIPLLAGSLP